VTARQRGSWGGSPRKYDDLLTGRFDLDVQSRWSCTSDGPPTGVLGRIPRKYCDLLTGLWSWMFSQDGAVRVRARQQGSGGGPYEGRAELPRTYLPGSLGKTPLLASNYNWLRAKKKRPLDLLPLTVRHKLKAHEIAVGAPSKTGQRCGRIDMHTVPC
jgi:hypothetical protein